MICVQANLPGQELKITDYQNLNLQEGLRNSVIQKIVRGPHGYFYLFSTSDIQKWDGKHFYDLNVSRDIIFKTYLQDFKDAKLDDSGNIYVFTSSPDSIYYTIDTKDDSHSLHYLEGQYQYVESEDQIYFQNQNEIYELIDSPDPHLELKYSMFQSTPINRIENIGNTWYIEAGKNVRSYGSESQISNNKYSGRLFKWGESILIYNRESISILKNGQLVELYQMPSSAAKGSDFSVPIKDKQGNLLFLVFEQNGHCQDYILIRPNHEVMHMPTEFVTYAGKGITAYAEDFMQKVLLGTYNGIVYFGMSMPGINHYVAFDSLPPNGFGNIVTDIIDDGNFISGVCERELLFRQNKETREITYPFRPYFLNVKLSDITNPLIQAQLEPSYFKSNNRIIIDPTSNKYFTLSYIFHEDSSILYTFSSYQEAPRRIAKIPNSYTGFRYWKEGMALLGGRDNVNQGVLSIFDTKNKSVTRQIYQDSRLARINSIFIDPEDKTVWLSTFKGPVHLSDKLEYLALDSGNKEELNWLRNADVRDINIVEDKIYFSTKIGFFIYDRRDQSLYHRNEYDGLSNSFCYSSEVDKAGYIWVSTHTGLSVLDSDFKTIATYYSQDGLGKNNNEFNTASSVIDGAGILYFGTINGLITIDPEKLLANQFSTGLKIKNIYYEHQGKQFIFSDYPKKNLDLPWGTDSIQIEITYPDFFSYSLQNNHFRGSIFDITSNSSMKRTPDRLHISNLRNQPAKIALMSDYNSLELDINFHRDFFSFLIYLFSIMLVVIVAIYVSKKIIANRLVRQEQEMMMQNRLNKLQLATLQAQMNPHFIFNVLGSIQYYIQSGHQSQAAEFLSDFGSLMRKFLEASRSEMITLEEEIDLISLYLEMEKIRFESKFDIDIITGEDMDLAFEIPPMIMQPFVENAVKHGILNLKGKKGLVQVHFYQPTENELQCIIIDNGIGRKKANEIRTNDYQSRAMEIVSDKIHLLKETGQMQIKIQIDDAYPEQENCGTKVTIDFEYIDEN